MEQKRCSFQNKFSMKGSILKWNEFAYENQLYQDYYHFVRIMTIKREKWDRKFVKTIYVCFPAYKDGKQRFSFFVAFPSHGLDYLYMR